MLMGEFQHNLDAKGRLFMPVKLREALGTKFVLTKGLDGCLFVYDLEQWRLLEAKLNSLPMTRKGARDFNRFFFGGAAEGECDKQGRVLLPVNLREFAGLDKNAVIVGVGNRLRSGTQNAGTHITRKCRRCGRISGTVGNLDLGI